MKKLTYHFKFTFNFNKKDFPTYTQFGNLPFARQIEYFKDFEKFKAEAKKGYVSQKRQKASKSIREFIILNQAKEYYTVFYDKKTSPDYWDDSFEIWYKN